MGLRVVDLWWVFIGTAIIVIETCWAKFVEK
jgi:hypothetical protein